MPPAIFRVFALLLFLFHGGCATCQALPSSSAIENMAAQTPTPGPSPSPPFAADPGPSPPFGLALLEGEPSALVGAGVNVISGDYYEGQVDLTIEGAQPLALSRCYCSGFHGKSALHELWNLSHCELIEEQGHGPKASISLKEGSGALFLFDPPSSPHTHAQAPSPLCLAAIMLKQGLVNTGRGALSARTNMKNLRLERSHSKYHLQDGSGTRRTFTYCPSEEGAKAHSDTYRLTLRRQPSGTSIKYFYSPQNTLQRVAAFGRTGRELASLVIDHPEDNFFQEHPRIVAYTSDQRHVSYLFERHSYSHSHGHGHSFYLSAAEPSDAAAVRYKYSEVGQKLRLSKVCWPKKRYLETHYYREGDKEVGRVKLQRAPVGPTSAPVTTHRFLYQLHKDSAAGKGPGSCTVYDALERCTSYFWDKHQRLKKIRRADGTTERIYWGSKKSGDEGNLLGRALWDATGQPLLARTFCYDQCGNVLCEQLSGELSGSSPAALALDKQGTLLPNGCESYPVCYAYDGSSYNLLLLQSDPRKSVQYRYVPGTDLLAAEFTSAAGGGAISLRHFYSYDENGVVVKEIIDDGCTEDKRDLTGVTERLIRRVTPTVVAPIGLPQELKDSYLDLTTGKERLLHRIVNSYGPVGARLERQEHYGSDGALAYVLQWAYDAHGNVIQESDPLGRTIFRRYDANDNLIWEQGLRSECHKEFRYDYANRLIAEEEIYTSGLCLANSYRYDLLGRCVAAIDIYGNETQYSYDAMGRRTEVVYPLAGDAAGGAFSAALEATRYDALGNAIWQSDARGYTTQATYNIRGQPLKIDHPDGTSERFYYCLDGSLRCHYARDGTSTHYEVDFLLRPIAKEQRDATGQLILRTCYRYNAFHLLEESDSMGRTVCYRYDGAGRLVETVQNGQKTTYAYDALGRQSFVCSYFGWQAQQFTAKHLAYNLVGQLIEEVEEDAFGNVQSKICYGYDCQGNCCARTSFSSAGVSTALTEYSARGDPIRWVDPQGSCSNNAIDYAHYNSFGQRVRYEEHTDPTGLITSSEYDALGRVALVLQRRQWSEFGCVAILASSTFSYDGDSHLCRRIDSIIDTLSGARLSTAATRWSYNGMGEVVELIEAEGAPCQRLTKFCYNALGQKQAVLYADGLSLHLQYDACGRLLRRFASDGSLHDSFEYDAAGRCTSATDCLKGTQCQRSYDSMGYLAGERLSNGLEMGYQRDLWGRIVLLVLPDGSRVGYRYSGKRLMHVDRYAVGGERRYSHTYTSYDLSGQVQSATLIGAVAALQCRYDLCGRLCSLAAGAWQQVAGSFDGVGNMQSKSCSDPYWGQDVNSSYSYDGLHQLCGETGPFCYSSQIDSLHNRREYNGQSAQYNALNQLLCDGRGSYSYDARGNLVCEQLLQGEVHYSYDALNRLVSVSKAGMRVSYSYDALERRVLKTHWEGGAGAGSWREIHCERFAFQEGDEIGMYDTLGVAQQQRILGASLRQVADIAAAVAIELQGQAYAPLYDLQGSVVGLLDSSSGAMAACYRYSAYGGQQQAFFDEPAAGNPWRWQGKRYDCESALIFFGRRYYSPEAARWLTTDPLGYDSGPNLYAYVGCRPGAAVDVYGLEPIEMQRYGREKRYRADNIGYQRPNSGLRAQPKEGGGNSSAGGSRGRGGGGAEPAEGRRASPLAQAISQGLSWIGQGISFVGQQLPVVGGMLSTLGQQLQGHYHSSGNYYVGNYFDPRQAFVMVNGIDTSFATAAQRAQRVSDTFGGCFVYFVYNATYSALADLGVVYLHKSGLCTSATHKLAGMVHYLSHVLDDQAPITICAHSHGGKLTYDLQRHVSAQLRLSRLNIETYGSATIIPRASFHKVDNYISSHDWVPRVADPAGLYSEYQKRSAGAGCTIIDLPSQGGWFDHSFEGPTYGEAFNTNVHTYKKKWEL